MKTRRGGRRCKKMSEEKKGWNQGDIRCYDCKNYKPVGHGYDGWCQDAKPKIKVNAVDFCDEAEKNE